jgi:hypothetical protein
MYEAALPIVQQVIIAVGSQDFNPTIFCTAFHPLAATGCNQLCPPNCQVGCALTCLQTHTTKSIPMCDKEKSTVC